MTVAEDRLDATFTALADPTRRAIVARLATGDATVNELAAPFDMTLPGISKHLKVLERCGLISRTRRAQFRPCHLEGDVLEPAGLERAFRQARRAPARSPASACPATERNDGWLTERPIPASSPTPACSTRHESS